MREPFRRNGVGKALLSQVAEIAREEGYNKIRLHVLDWNESAIKFYKSLGAEYLPQLRNVVIGAEAWVALAAIRGFHHSRLVGIGNSRIST